MASAHSKHGLRAAEIKADAKALVRAKLTTPDPRASKIAFWDWLLATDVMTWSDAMKMLFGLEQAAADRDFDPRAALRSVLHPEDLPAVEKCLTLAARDGTPIAMNCRVILPDGSIRRIEIDGDVIRDRDGRVVRIAGSCRNATRWKRAEEDLASQNQQLEASLAERTSELDDALRRLERRAYELTENIPVGTYTFVKRPGERLGRYEFMSNRFIEMQGLDREAIAADFRNGMAVLHPDDADEYARLNLEAIDEEKPFRGQARQWVNGAYRWIAAEDITRKLPDGTVIWEGVVTDITERKAMEAALAEARAREKRTEEQMRATLERKLKTSLNAAAVAHEINQPLSRILLRARINLERSRGRNDQMLRALIDDAERVVSTIEKMKVLLRNVESVQKDVDLHQVMTSALHQIKAMIRAGKVKISQNEPQEACIVRGDAVQLKMVFVNLIQNALDAASAGGTKRKRISIELIAHKRVVEVVIGDSGPGWPGGTLDEMLLNTSKPGGSGIGLYVVKTAVENHRGKITIGRSPLGGAEFRIVLPVPGRARPDVA